MARQVTDLWITQQTGSDNTYVARWSFKGDEEFVQPSSFVGLWCNLKQGATYYNGTPIPSEYFNYHWMCLSVNGDQATLGQNGGGDLNFNGSVSTNYLTATWGSITPDMVNTLDHFTVHWYYDAGDGVWYDGQESDIDGNLTVATYSPPDNMVALKCDVLPVAKTYKVKVKDANGNETEVDQPYWNGTWVYTLYYLKTDHPEQPPVPTVELADDGYTLIITVENINDPNTDQIQFAIFDDDVKVASATVRVVARRATYSYVGEAGKNYRVLCRSMRVTSSGGATYSDWTELSDRVQLVPSTPSGITILRAASSTSVYMEWSAVDSADSYDIEYATNVTWLGSSNSSTTQTGIETTYYTLTGLESGDEYFFRVRAVNEAGESGWTAAKSVVIGKAPAAPTTWSSASTIVVGRELNLYWVHNAEDGSKETYAQLEITTGDHTETHTIENPNADDDEEEDTAHHYTVDTTDYPEGTQLKWRVRTAGVTKEYGDWSVMRTVDIYAPPTLRLSLEDSLGADVETLTSFPLIVKGFAGPNTQAPIGYHITVKSDSQYETIDQLGRRKMVYAGDTIFSKQLDTGDELVYELTASNIDLQSGASYTVEVVVSMNSGLTATATMTFDVVWTEMQYDVNIGIAIEGSAYYATLTPYCLDPEDNTTLPSNVTLGVYRREFDDTFTEIASNLPNTRVAVTDPHPPLDYARYRVVAIDSTTGAVSYYDPPAYPVAAGLGEVVIQWDEVWPDYVQPVYQRGMNGPQDDGYLLAGPMWRGTLLKLPWNIDTTENNIPEATLVNYIGRRYPVSYYGTQIDSKASWSIEIDAKDTDTLYLLRRLSMYQGDVYVREPRGMGYWANVGVSFTITHQELTIPVTLDITRVEGGM